MAWRMTLGDVIDAYGGRWDDAERDGEIGPGHRIVKPSVDPEGIYGQFCRGCLREHFLVRMCSRCATCEAELPRDGSECDGQGGEVGTWRESVRRDRDLYGDRLH